jgi:arsenate reductase
MKKFFFLSSCSTCKRLLKELKLPGNIELQDIKADPISKKEIEKLHELSGSYEALFSKRAQLYKEKDLKNKSLTESDFKNLLLEHYTFLKRPVLILDKKIFIGNASKTIEVAKKALDEQP